LDEIQLADAKSRAADNNEVKIGTESRIPIWRAFVFGNVK